MNKEQKLNILVDRNNAKCHFCGSTVSIKYLIKHNGKDVPCCNKCALVRI